MSDQMPPYETPDAQPPKRKLAKTILIIIAAILIPSCLMCVWKLWDLFQPGEPLPAAAFIDDDTTGIVVLRIDGSDPNVKKMLAYAANEALEQDAPAEFNDLLQFIASENAQKIPGATLVASYKGRTPDDLRLFNVLSLRQIPGLYRFFGAKMYNAFVQEAAHEEYQSARIVSVKKLMEIVRSQGKGQSPQIPSAPWAEAYHCTLFDSCFIAGKTSKDVEAGVAALLAPEPAAESEQPFMRIYRHADSTALCFGALSNENDLLLTALFSDADKREDAREFLEPILTLDPRQVTSIAFSADLVSDDEAVVKLWLDCANNDIAEQLEAAIRAFVNSHSGTTEDIPFELAIDEDATSTQGAVHEAVIRISGIKEWISQNIPQLIEAMKALSKPQGAAPDAKEAGPGEEIIPETAPIEEPAVLAPLAE